MNNSKEKAIEIIIREKNSIKIATDEILKIVKKIEEKGELDSQDRFTIRTKINEIVSSLSIIVGFCDRNAQNLVRELAIVGLLNTVLTNIEKMDYILKRDLEIFCTVVNSLIVDFNKRPFKFEAEFEVKIRELIARIKTAYEKGA